MSYGIVNADQIGTSVQGYSLGAGNSSLLKNKIINGETSIKKHKFIQNFGNSFFRYIYTK